MASNDKKEKKIIIDEDWKEQAQKEKENLAEKEKIDHDVKEEEKQRPPLPEADLSGLISMLATHAFFAMGVVRTEEDKDKEPDLDMAKFNIDMIGVIEEKTSGNITEEEAELLKNTLHQLRMTFIKISK